jgi:hypothetical protein
VLAKKKKKKKKSQAGPWRCRTCRREFHAWAQLRDHRASAHGVAPIPPPPKVKETSRATYWFVLTSKDWEDDLLDYLSPSEDTDWLTPRYDAVRELMRPGDRVIVIHGRTRRAHVTGTITGRPVLVPGSVEWRNGRVLTDREWWDWHVDHRALGGVETTGAEDEAIRHPADEYGGQNGWMAPVPRQMWKALEQRMKRIL